MCLLGAVIVAAFAAPLAAADTDDEREDVYAPGPHPATLSPGPKSASAPMHWLSFEVLQVPEQMPRCRTEWTTPPGMGYAWNVYIDLDGDPSTGSSSGHELWVDMSHRNECSDYGDYWIDFESQWVDLRRYNQAAGTWQGVENTGSGAVVLFAQENHFMIGLRSTGATVGLSGRSTIQVNSAYRPFHCSVMLVDSIPEFRVGDVRAGQGPVFRVTDPVDLPTSHGCGVLWEIHNGHELTAFALHLDVLLINGFD